MTGLGVPSINDLLYGRQGQKDTLAQTMYGGVSRKEYKPEQSKIFQLEQEIAVEEAKAKAYNIPIKIGGAEKSKIKLWDFLEWARYPITNMLYTAAREAKEEKLEFNDIGKILKSAIAGAMLKEKKNTEDVIELLYPDAPKWVKVVAGLAGDILTDPATWLTFGAAGGIKGAVKAGKIGRATVAKTVKKIAREGAQGAVAKRLITKYGGKTWQEAAQIARRKIAQEVGDYGLRVGVPFVPSLSKKIGPSRIGLLQKMATKVGVAPEAVKAFDRIPIAIRGLPGISGIRKAFGPAAKYGAFGDAHQIERSFTRGAEWRVEQTVQNFKTLTKELDNVLISKSDDAVRVLNMPAIKKLGKTDKTRALEYIRMRQELVAGAKGAKAKKIVAEKYPIPEEWKFFEEKVRTVFNDFWEGFTKRGMIKGERFIEAYYPRYYANKAGELAVVKIKEFGTAASFFNTRQIKTIAEARKMGFKPVDLLESLKIYATKAHHVVATFDMAEEMAKQFGRVAKTVPEGFTRITIKGLTDRIVPDDIGRVLNTVNTVMTRAEGAAKLGNYYSKLLNMWKRQATIYNPGFHARNAISNIWTGIFKDGMGVRQLANQAKAIDIWSWAKHPDKLIEVTLKGKRVKRTAKELYEIFRKSGIHTGGFAAAEVAPGLAKRINVLEKAGSTAGNFVENTARIASGLCDMDKGIDIADSVKRVSKFFLDYSDFTPFEKGIKKVIPFYSWMKKNLVHQIDQMVKNPGKYTMFTSKPLRALDMLPGEEKEWQPEWMQEQMQINPMGIQTGRGNPLMLNPNLPFQDVNQLSSLESVKDMLVGGLSPLIKTPIELELNKSAFTGKPLQYTESDYKPAPPLLRITVALLPDFAKERLGIKMDASGQWIMPGKWVHALSSLLPILKAGGSIERLIQTMTGADMPEYRQERAPYDVLSRTAGVKMRPFDVGYYKEKALGERLKELKGLTSLIGAKL